MIEHLFDEALVNALRRGEQRDDRADVERARLIEEVGMGQPVAYTDHEKRLIATHEAGHAVDRLARAPRTAASRCSRIIKRRDALGMLAHGDAEDVFTRSRSEMLALIQIAMGGQVGRGAVLRRHLHRSRRATCSTPPTSRPRWSAPPA